MRMSNEQRQSRSGRNVTLAVICLNNSTSDFFHKSWVVPIPDNIPDLCPDLLFLLDCFLHYLSLNLFALNPELPPVLIQNHAAWRTRQNHLSKTSLVSTLLSTTTSFFTLPCTNQSLICARMSFRNFWTWNTQFMERKEHWKENYALSSVETKRVRPYSCFLVKLSGG